MAQHGLTQLGYRDPFKARVLQPAETVGSHDGEMSRDECQVHGEPVLRLLPDPPNPYFRTEQERLEDGYFGRRPVTCDASTPLEGMPYHNKSAEQYTHMKRLGQLPKAPNVMYREPLTTSQQYGWWLPRDPDEKLEKSEPWTSVVRYPLTDSEMTRYVNHMTLTNPEFSLF